MPCVSRHLPYQLRTLATGSLLLMAMCCGAFAQQAGHILGHIDGIGKDGDHFFLSGWACQQGQTDTIMIHVFDGSKHSLVAYQWANLQNEPMIATACQDHGKGKHRFMVMLPYGYGPDSKLDVHGIRAVAGVANDSIAGSNQALAEIPMPQLQYPPHPTLAGAYRNLAERPRVFTTAAELNDLVLRINRPNSYSAQRFKALAAKIKQDLASGVDWGITYAGCDGSIYQYAFSYEPQDGLEAKMRAALKVGSTAKYPTGAAVVASRLALYATLVKRGAQVPPDAPSGDSAAALAKRIMLAWAEHGFPRDAQGNIVPLLSMQCAKVSGEMTGKSASSNAVRDTGELSLGRGVLYSVQAQDLLQSLNVLSSKEERELNALHSALYELLRQAHNQWFGGLPLEYWPFPNCVRYGNVAANAMVSLLASARVIDDGRRFDAALQGGDRAIPVLLPWVDLFPYLIYGEDDTPWQQCTKNAYPDSLTSLKNQADFTTPTVAPGEIFDRGRNHTPIQGIGYPMFTLERLFDTAEMMRIAGFDAYGYRGRHRQSIEMAADYYACYAKSAGFYQVVSAQNAGACPNAQQYYGKLVSGVDANMLVAAFRFPYDAAIGNVLPAAKAAATAGAFSTDAILFGKWPD
ncbi:hypothetical protein [Paludibacterium purpuratum]|uniref:Uncharacterized protein n=1 Tax=Paludibacterium purpuratum TaxID=1144873 RepID=A0A4R7B4L9_9NEIS|nr:hypothetical protein [Paludibacterium purpuratum]TDR77934.1 hypothetical protein DFP86_109181 [Paludibacterium purpuratum]